jgi:hypothetical protein
LPKEGGDENAILLATKPQRHKETKQITNRRFHGLTRIKKISHKKAQKTQKGLKITFIPSVFLCGKNITKAWCLGGKKQKIGFLYACIGASGSH